MPNELNTTNRRILVIDDNRAIHDDFRKILCPQVDGAQALAEAKALLFGAKTEAAPRSSFQIDSAYQGQEGFALVQQSLERNEPYAMAFVDVRMPPGWDGIETIARIWQEYPDLQVVVCTAYSDYSLEDILKRLGQSDRLVILKKPFDNIEVLQLAYALTEKWQLLQQAKAKTGELERRVLERTGELQAANERLQNEMIQRSQAEEALRQAQKMEAVGQLAGGIAHDFNNLLTIILGYTSFLIEDEDLDSKAHASLQQVDSAAKRAANLTRQLLTFSRKQVTHLEHLNLGEVITQVTKMLDRVLGEDIALQIVATEGLPGVHADRAMLEQIILNLAVNARDAMPNGGRLTIRTSALDLSAEDAARQARGRSGSFVSFEVTDSGCGIGTEVMPHLFEPFFTTKEVGKGTGLGLATVYGIVKQHEGWIEVDSEPGQGATFRVFLPADLRQKALAAEAVPVSGPAGGSETILMVEDEPILRSLLRTVLQRYGYRVLAASSGVEALKLWQQHGPTVDLLLTDMVMPDGVSGGDLAKKLKAERPELKVIFSSGYSLELLGPDNVLAQGLSFLAKPYTPDKLAQVLRECLDKEPAAAEVAA